MKTIRTFYLSGTDINYKETDSEGNVAVTGFVATLQAGDHDFTPPIKAFELGLDLITRANAHGDMLAALKAIQKEFVGDRNSSNVFGPLGTACDMVHAAIAKADTQ